ncbi:MAG TPA: hypothetical protein VHM88_16480 [Candidatus Acidoferrales bacterium]|nr:hypothetical protein [Candidatus Acidoferrales bacterium]
MLNRSSLGLSAAAKRYRRNTYLHKLFSVKPELLEPARRQVRVRHEILGIATTSLYRAAHNDKVAVTPGIEDDRRFRQSVRRNPALHHEDALSFWIA